MTRLRALTLLAGSALMLAWVQQGLAQTPAAPPSEDKSRGQVVPYCIEPMDSMPERIRALIEAQFLCAPGTHLQRDSRPARVIPSGEEGRPFVLRFGPEDKANAWYVRGYAVESR